MKEWTLFIKEFSEFRRFFKLDKAQRNVVVYSEDSSYYTFFEGIIDELAGRHNMKLCYVTSEHNDSMLRTKRKNINAFYIRHLLGFFILLLDSRLILMTMPDLNKFHIKKSVRGANHIYLFHNIGSYFHVIRRGGLFHYDTMFAVSPHQIRELRREEQLYKLPQRTIVKFGYYRLDKMHRDYKKWKSAGKKIKTKFKARILVAPGWGPWEERTSMLDICGSKLIRKLLDSDFEVILRPHPMTRKRYPEFLDALYAEFKNRSNFKPEENVSSLESFYSSDIMISDWSGVVYEYAFGTERPVLFINTPIKINNPEYKKFGIEPIDIKIRNQIGFVLQPNDVDRVDAVAARMVREKEKYKKRIIMARKKLIFNLGRSSSAGAKFIIDFLSKTK